MNFTKLTNAAQEMYLRAGVAIHALALSRADMRMSARATLVSAALGATVAQAQQSGGLVTAISNGSLVIRSLIAFFGILGVLAGMAFIFSAGMDMYRKGDNNNRDDITWGKIAQKALAGMVTMTITYWAVQLVATFGGTTSDIGKGLAVTN